MSDLTFLRNKYGWMDLQYLFICFVLSLWYFHHTPPISNASSRRISSFCRVHVSLLYNAKLQTDAFIIQFFRWRNVWRVKVNSTWTVRNNNQYIKSKHLGRGRFFRVVFSAEGLSPGGVVSRGVISGYLISAVIFYRKDSCWAQPISDGLVNALYAFRAIT